MLSGLSHSLSPKAAHPICDLGSNVHTIFCFYIKERPVSFDGIYGPFIFFPVIVLILSGVFFPNSFYHTSYGLVSVLLF